MKKYYVLQSREHKFREFHLCFCGYEQCEPGHFYGPASRPNYILHFVLKGKGTYQVGGRSYPIQAGQGFLIEPKTMTSYWADCEDPWTYLWIGFGGTGAKSLLEDIGLNSCQLIFHSRRGEQLKGIIWEMLSRRGNDLGDLYALQAGLYQFFSVLVKDLQVEIQEVQGPENEYVQKALIYIQNHYSQGIGVDQIAADLNISRSYLYTVFKKTLDLSPKEFLMKFQLSQAREQLSLTDLTAEAIAYSCGYRSSLAFSRAFKKETGMTPLQYRENARKDSRNNF